MLFVLIAFLQDARPGAHNRTHQSTAHPGISVPAPAVSGGLLLLAAWIIASVLRWVFFRGLSATKLDERLRKSVAFEKERRV